MTSDELIERLKQVSDDVLILPWNSKVDCENIKRLETGIIWVGEDARVKLRFHTCNEDFESVDVK